MEVNGGRNKQIIGLAMGVRVGEVGGKEIMFSLFKLFSTVFFSSSLRVFIICLFKAKLVVLSFIF